MSVKQGSTLIAGMGATFPAQSGQSGKYLTTNGTTPSWAAIDTLPSSTKYGYSISYTNNTTLSLKDQDGTTLSTVSIPIYSIDNLTITYDSNNQYQVVGQIDKNTNTAQFDWIGTLAEYTAQAVGTTHPEWMCYITDDAVELNVINWSDIGNKPTFATVASTGSYNDLLNKPVLATIATTGDWGSLMGTPTTLTGYGITDAANNNLSNLTTSGQAIIDAKAEDSTVVHKSGYLAEEVTGVKTFSNSSSANMLVKCTNINTSTTPSSTVYAGIQFNDYNGTRIAKVEPMHDTNNRWGLLLSTGPRSSTYSTLNLQIDSSGNAYFSFPKCTTAAGTSSTAASDKVAVVTQNYKNGTTWYRVWSDGWKEQGGRTATVNMGTAITVTFSKAFSDSNYYMNAKGTLVSTDDSWFESDIYSRGTSTAIIRNRRYTGSGTDTLYYSWYACGY